MSGYLQERLTRRTSTLHLRYVAAALAYVVAALHLFHPKLGFAQLIVRLSADPALLAADPRPIAFVLSGIALVAGVTIALFGTARKPLYVLGAVLMITYVVGYFAWHFTGHGGFLPGRETLYHGFQPHEAVAAHLTGDLWAATAILAELLLLGVLTVLYYRE